MSGLRLTPLVIYEQQVNTEDRSFVYAAATGSFPVARPLFDR